MFEDFTTRVSKEGPQGLQQRPKALGLPKQRREFWKGWYFYKLIQSHSLATTSRVGIGVCGSGVQIVGPVVGRKRGGWWG